MSGSTATLRRVLATVPGGGAVASRLRGRRAVRRLLATGRFDAAWYGAQAGQGFASDADAARDYLLHGRRAGLSPNPLFEPEWYDPDTALTRADDPFTSYLGRIGELRSVSPHLLLDPAAVIAAHPEAATHRHGPLGWVLDHRGSEALPVPWEALQERLGEAVAVWREQDALRRAPRRSRSFDAAAERRWRAALGAQPRPSAGEGGRPVVSIVLPVRDRSGPLRRAVESVQAQTLRDWELIVVDDGSTDDTPHVLEGVRAQEPRVRVIRQDCGGVSRARNRGIAAAHGELLAFLDSDNTWRRDFLDLAVRAMRRDQLDVAYAAMELRGGDGRREYRAFDGGPEHLLLGNHIDLNVLLARTELVRAVGGFAENLRRAVDYDLVLRLAARSRPAYLPFIGAVYSADSEDRSRISVAEPLAWDFVVRSRHAVDWAAARARAGARVAGRVSVVVPVHDDAAAVARCVAALLASPPTPGVESPGPAVPPAGTPSVGPSGDLAGDLPGNLPGAGSPGADVEVVVVDLGSRRGASVALAALAAVQPRLRVHRIPVDAGPALGVNLTLPHTTGEFVAVCHPDVLVGAGWLAPLLAQLQDPAVAAAQPLVLDVAGAIVAAGATFTAAPGQPVPLLHGHPVEDAARLGPVVPVPGVDGPVWLARAADLLAAEGLDPLAPLRWQATDLTLRIAGDRGAPAGRLVTGAHAVLAGPVPGRAAAPPAGVNLDDGQVRRRWAAAAPATGRSLWRQAGFAVTGHRVHEPVGPWDARVTACVARGWRAGLAAGAESVGPDDRPALRWRVRGTSLVAGRAEAIAAALRRWEQDAVVDLSGRPAPRGELDDVTLVLVGPADEVPAPDPATPSLLWLLDPGRAIGGRIGPARAAGYGRVLWAGDCAGSAHALPPAVDPMLFRPAAADEAPAALLVPADLDQVSPLLRAGVHAAVSAGLPVDVRGRGWEAFLPPGTVVAPPLTPHRRAGAYAGARAVLLDAAAPGGGGAPAAGVLPWVALQAVACGAPVLLAVPDPAHPADRAAPPDQPAPPDQADPASGAGEVGALVRGFTSPQQLLELLDQVTRAGGQPFADAEARRRVARSVAVSDSFDARAFRLVQVAAELVGAGQAVRS